MWCCRRQSPGLLSWARLNPLTGIVFPLLTFVLALVGGVGRRPSGWWCAGSPICSGSPPSTPAAGFSVRPVQAEQMPPEIRELAETLEDMADAIVGRDASLRDSLAQKDALMREIHHRVKNNLQVISSLLNMQQRALTDPAARAAMSDTRQRITALALIYRALYQGPDLKRVDLRPFLEELTAQLVAGELVARAGGAHRARRSTRWSSTPTGWRRWPCSRSRRSPTPRSTPSPGAAAC